MSALKRDRGNRRGIMLVEAALMLPLLLTLTFALFEYGWIFIKVQELRNTASTAARVGSLVPQKVETSMTAKADLLARAMLAEYRIEGASITFDPSNFDDAGLERGDAISVRITVAYKGSESLELIGFPLIPLPETLSVEATFPKQ